MNNSKSTCRGSGILIMFLILVVLLTFLFLMEEMKKQGPVTRPPEGTKGNVKTEEKKEIKDSIPSDIEKHSGQIALIIDDVGWNPEITTWVKRFNIPLTLPSYLTVPSVSK